MAKPTISEQELEAAFELPRVYHLLKLCFVGGDCPLGRSGSDDRSSGNEPFPPECLDVLTLLAGRASCGSSVTLPLAASGRRATRLSCGSATCMPLEMDPINAGVWPAYC